MAATGDGSKPEAGSTMRQGGQGEPHTWSRVDGNYFKVRQTDYKKHPSKDFSGDSLYELLAVDCFASSEPILNISSRVTLPQPIVHDDGTLPVPSLFVLNCILPKDSPQVLGKPKMDSYQVVLYFGLKPETLEAVRAMSTNSIKLFKRWVDQAPHNDDVRHTFKFIAFLDNISTLGLGGFLEGYNGKPVLVTKSGSLHQGGGGGSGQPWVMEVGMNVHVFNVVARKAFSSVRDRIKDFDARVAFVIQGHTDDELPEQILGAAALQFVNLANLRPWLRA